MEIEIFSDVVCPWCAIGKRRFERALEQFASADEVNVVWRAFELDPTAPPATGGDLASHLAQKYGMSKEQALASQVRLTALAEEEGLDFHLDRAQRANTFDAHRLLHHARELGLQNALKDRLFRAYFTEGELVSDRRTLTRLGAEVGLDEDKSSEVLETGRYGTEVRADEREAQELGVSGVPFFVIDRRYGISGAQPTETFLQVMEKVWDESRSSLSVIGDEAGACTEESCELPN